MVAEVAAATTSILSDGRLWVAVAAGGISLVGVGLSQRGKATDGYRDLVADLRVEVDRLRIKVTECETHRVTDRQRQALDEARIGQLEHDIAFLRSRIDKSYE